MTTDGPRGARIFGTLRAADGGGVVRLEDRFATTIEDLWSALTDPARLARWIGDVEGDLRQGGELTARWFASGWEATCHIEVCDRPRRLLVTTRSAEEPDGVIEATLTASGDETVLVVECRGLPLEPIAAYGAGNQIHVEDLAAYLAGKDPCEARSRWEQLHPGYLVLAAALDEASCP